MGISGETKPMLTLHIAPSVCSSKHLAISSGNQNENVRDTTLYTRAVSTLTDAFASSFKDMLYL